MRQALEREGGSVGDPNTNRWAPLERVRDGLERRGGDACRPQRVSAPSHHEPRPCAAPRAGVDRSGLLAHPPLQAPRPLRPIINGAARRIASRFLTTYRTHSPHTIDSDALTWYHSLQACRVLLDLAGWRADGTADLHRGHPWFALEPVVRPLLSA